MNKLSILIIFFIFPLILFATEKAIIKGKISGYTGKEIRLFETEDYFSYVKHQVASVKVAADSSFEISFEINEIKKMRIEIDRNHFNLYVQPGATYNLMVESSSPYIDNNAAGGEVEFFFLNLDTSDVNYQILMFEDAQLNFLKQNYNYHSLNSEQFVVRLDSFKLKMESRYKTDTSTFLKTYIKYSIASLDNLSFLGNRNKFEKFNFYIKNEAVHYQNDRYMDYITHFYDRYESELSNEVSNEFYKSILKSSPTLIMKALGGDYSLKNIRIRELIMIKMLSEIFYSGKYPQTNIVTVLDSLGDRSLFKEHENIAKNIKFRLLDLQPGTKMPNFKLLVGDEEKKRDDYAGKHVYIQFVSKENSRSIDDLKLMVQLYPKYAQYVDFITVLVCEKEDKLLNDPSQFIKAHEISWDFHAASEKDEIIKQLGVTNFPKYLLMDAAGYVVSAHALSPRPNNEYETIERSLRAIVRYYKSFEK